MMKFLAGLCLLLIGGVSGAMADPALWVARSPSATVYLFGTVHVLPKADAQGWLGPAIRDALAASSELWTEADIGDLSASVASIRRYGLDPAHDVASLLPPAYRDRFARRIATAGVPGLLVAHARPWLAGILLNAAAMQQAGALTLGVEPVLLGYAHTHHLRTPTFETLDEQFALLADMPQATQVKALEEQIDEFDQTGPMFAKLLAAWRAGDEDTLDRLTNKDMQAHDEATWTELVLRRNERFAQKIGERLAGTGTAFVAVGAAHLCGLTGVPALLERAGFRMERKQ